MKVGDLVKWTYYKNADVGIIIDVEKPHDDAQGHAYIHWFKNPETSGMYRISHHFLEVVQ